MIRVSCSSTVPSPLAIQSIGPPSSLAGDAQARSTGAQNIPPCSSSIIIMRAPQNLLLIILLMVTN